DRNRSHWSTSKTPSYTKSVSWQHHLFLAMLDFATVYTVAFFVTLPDALRLSGLHDLCNI
ncbi:hypothetical protein ABHC23_22400, partial [Escherichia coli]